MARPAQKKHASGLVEVKATVGKTLAGKRIQKSFYGTSKLDAQRKAEKYKLDQEVANRTGETFIKKDYTFGEWANKWLEVYKKPTVSENTYDLMYRNTVVNHLIPYFGKADLTDIKNIDVQAFFTSKKHMSDSMLGKMHSCLLAIFDVAIENDLCYKNPVKRISVISEKDKNIKRVLNPGRIVRLEKIARLKMPDVVLLLETGLRRGELLGLKWEDIDFKEGTLSVNRSIADSKTTRIKINPPKWDSYRTLPLSETATEVLKSLTKTNDYIFPNSNNEIRAPHSWSQNLATFMKSVSIKNKCIPPLTAHEMRHTYGTNLRRKEIDIYTIQKVMGHKDIKMTTELYVHNEVEELKKAMKNAL